MQNTCKKKQHTVYIGIIPSGYYFDGTRAVPKEEVAKIGAMAKYLQKETPVICMPDGKITLLNNISLEGYYLNDVQIDRDTIYENALQMEHGRVTNKKYKTGDIAMPWKMLLYKGKAKTYDVIYKEGNYYVREEKGVKEYSPSLFKTMFNNRGFEKELEKVGCLDFTPEPLFEVKNAGDADFADKVIYKLNTLYEKSFVNYSLGILPKIKKQNKNSVIVELEEQYELKKEGEKYYIKASGETFVCVEKEKEFMTYVIAILGYFSNSTLHSFYQEQLTGEEYNYINNYTASDYESINKYLRGEQNSFLDYLKAQKLHAVLSKSHVYKNICLFRGISLKNEIYKKIKAGYILKDEGFKSTSFKADIGTAFMDTTVEKHGVYCIINCIQSTHCLYIHDISNVTEYETLLDITYDLEFVKQLGTYDGVPVWLTRLVKNKKKLEEYLYKRDCIEQVINIIQSDVELKQKFYIKEVKDSLITLCQLYNEENDVKLSVSGTSLTLVADGQVPKYMDLQHENIANILTRDIKTCYKEVSCDDLTVYKINQKISQNLVSILIAENIVINSLEIAKMNSYLQIYVDSYNSTNDLETLNVEMKYRVEDKDIYLSMECTLEGELRTTKEVKVTPKTIDRIGACIFEYLIANYKLNCERRLRHIIKLVGGYYMKESDIEKYGRGFRAHIGDKDLYIYKVGNKLQANGLEFDYADNIYEIANVIKNQV